MVYVRKINDYYVLAHSIRKGSKVIQKTKYIGKKLPTKKKLEPLKEQFLHELNETKYKYLSVEDIAKIEAKKEAYIQKNKKLSALEKKKNLENFLIRFTYDSSKLSGVDITLRQTHLILKDGIIPKGFKNLNTVKEIENHKKGVVAVTKYTGQLNVRFIKKLHNILLSGVDDSIAGKFRNELERNVEIAGTTYTPPSWKILHKEIDNFFKWYKSENRKLHSIELAALIHLKLISLQLFVDGNSRLSRLIMNWVLWRRGYPMIDIKVEDLENYYNAFDMYQIEKKEKPFVKYIKKKFLEN